MADIRCPSCRRENPDFLDVCQFCQTPLKDEAKVHIGDKPTKKDTGELEPALPEWLRDVRKQARDSAEEEAAQEASMPKIQKDEPPDLLAGLAFQSAESDEEAIPDWLTGLSSRSEQKPVPPFAPGKPEAPISTTSEESDSGQTSEPAVERDELSDWFTQASEQPAEPFTLEPDDPTIQSDLESGQLPISSGETPPPHEKEDLSWLRNLEDVARKTGELTSPKQGTDWHSEAETPATSESSDQEDLSWLNNLGALPAAEEPVDQPSQPAEDLSWLNSLAGTSEPAQPESTPPAASEDLSWLNDLGEVPVSEGPASQPSEPREDLSWLKNLQGSSDPLSELPFTDSSPKQDQPTEIDESKDEMPSAPPFTPRQTAPLSDQSDSSIPDWLRSAAEEPSLPLGSQALDQFREDFHIPSSEEEPFSWKSFVQGMEPAEEEPTSPEQQPPSADPDTSTEDDSATLSNQDVDSLFSMDMPDWLSRPEPESSETIEDIGIHAEGGEALSPAELPSWVQAMRPVEAAISTTVPGVEDQPAEREGPLAGFRGVIPAAPIGSSRRPQPIPLKLQATDEQQASAALLEQLLLGETTARPHVSTPVVISQRMLRWVIAGLVWIVLGTVVFLRTQIMPVPASLPAHASEVTNVVMNLSEDAPVLVVVDYDPALAGEMEAVSGPLLDQLVTQRHPHLSFIATSPNGTALVERLLANTNINQPDGLGYISGQNYVNMGYLPGGESGVLAFMQSPQTAISSSPVLGFSEYAALVLLTDHAESARIWVEQLHALKQTDLALAAQPLLTVSSAQAGPMLQPYVSSGQIDGLINGMADAARYEFINSSRPGIARSYWDAFGIGIMLAAALIVLGSLWSLFTGMRIRRADGTQE
jgi:hypothetical protein